MEYGYRRVELEQIVAIKERSFNGILGRPVEEREDVIPREKRA